MKKVLFLWLLCFGSSALVAQPPSWPHQYIVRTFGGAEGLPGAPVLAIVQDARGYLWVGTRWNLARFDGVSFSAFKLPPEIGPLRALRADPGPGITVETDGGVYRFDGTRFVALEASKVPGGTLEVPVPGADADIELSALAIDRDAVVWATAGGTLLRQGGRGFQPFPSIEPLAGRRVLSLTTDHEGTLWIGTDEKLFSLRPNPFVQFGKAEGLADDWVFSVCPDGTGAMWIGGAGGLDRLAPDGSVTHYSDADGVPPGPAWPLGEDLRGRLLVGTMTETLVRDGESFRDSGFLPAGSGVLVTRSGELWLATLRDGVLRVGETRRVYTTGDGLGADEVYALAEGPRGEIWIGTSVGLSRFQDGVLTDLGLGPDLETDLVSALYDDARGNLWIGTLSSGLVRYRDGAFTALSGGAGLNLFTVHEVVDDQRGDLWLASNKGIYRVGSEVLAAYADGLAPTISARVYTEADGLRSGDSTSFAQPLGLRDRKGKLWFGTARGAVRVDPVATRNPAPPPVVIETVTEDGQAVEVRSPILLPPGTRRLQLGYTGLSFRSAGSTRFRYRLRGYDKAWIDAGTERSAVYTNLPPGSYTFQVLAENDSGLWSQDGASLEVVLSPRLYERWTFQAACIALGLLGVVGFHRLRLRVQLRRNLLLARLHDELVAKSQEIADKNAEIEQLMGTISSDVKTSISRFREALERMEHDTDRARGSADEGLRPHIEKMRSAAGEIDVLFDELLSLTDSKADRPKWAKAGG